MTLQPLIFCILDRHEKSELVYLRKKKEQPIITARFKDIGHVNKQ